jgi:hypothetical protein
MDDVELFDINSDIIEGLYYIETDNYKNTSILKELCDNNLIQLSKCRRSDDTLFSLIQFDNIPNLKNQILTTKIQKLIFVGPMKQ